jgi:hypothetical protein
MKIMLLVIGLSLFGTSAFAGSKASPPFALSAGIEQVWSKLDVPENHGTKQYDSDVKVNLKPSFELRENIYLTGRVTYPVRSQLPEFAVGIEAHIY